jgi:hypothetical protein
MQIGQSPTLARNAARRIFCPRSPAKSKCSARNRPTEENSNFNGHASRSDVCNRGSNMDIDLAT